MNKSEYKQMITSLMDQKKLCDIHLQKLVFDYCKMEGLVPASREFSDDFPYKKYIREEFKLVI